MFRVVARWMCDICARFYANTISLLVLLKITFIYRLLLERKLMTQFKFIGDKSEKICDSSRKNLSLRRNTLLNMKGRSCYFTILDWKLSLLIIDAKILKNHFEPFDMFATVCLPLTRIPNLYGFISDKRNIEYLN